MKVFSLPVDVKEPTFNEYLIDGRYSYERAQEVDDEFLARAAAKLRGQGYTGKLTGKVIRFRVADSYAQYMVAQKGRSMVLIHLPLGDAWQIPAAHARGLTQADVRAQLDRAASVCSKRKAEQ